MAYKVIPKDEAVAMLLCLQRAGCRWVGARAAAHAATQAVRAPGEADGPVDVLPVLG